MSLDHQPIGVEALLARSSAKVTLALFALLKGRYTEHALEKYARELLGLNPPPSASAGYRSDSVHPLYRERGTIHPDNEDSLVYVARPHLVRARELSQLTAHGDIQAALSNDMLLFGSPASEGLSRVVFGYSLYSRGEFVPFEQPLFDMAYRWELDEASVRGRPVRRYVRGRPDAPLRPPWAIRNLAGNGKSLIYKPEPYRDGPLEGFLKDDYLLITRVPNFLTDAYCDGSSIISFGGAHGTATRAVKLLLKSKRALQDIARTLPPSEGRLPSSYQILLRVHDIDHDKRRGSQPRAISFIDAVQLQPKESYRAWDDAQRAVTPRMDWWLGGKE